MNKKIPIPLAILIILFVMAIIIGVVLWLCPEKETVPPKDETTNLILFEKEEGWGPCPPNNICIQTTKLYYSGELVLEGEKNIKKELDEETIEKIKNQIKLSGIMDKDCWIKTPVPDYSATYNFYLEGKIKKMRYPNCEEELKEIEAIIK